MQRLEALVRSLPARPSGTAARDSEEEHLGTVAFCWTDSGCLLELQGRIGERLLDHARDLVYAQTRPLTCLTVRLNRAVVTGDVVAMLVAARRFLSRFGTQLEVLDPERRLPELARELNGPDSPR